MNRNFIRAFTLVELLITLAVLGTAVGVGTVSYVSFNERQIIKQTANDFKSNLRQNQQRALSGEKDTGIICEEAGQPLNLAGWCFSPSTDPSNDTIIDGYTFYGSCGPKTNDEVETFPEDNQQIKQKLPGGVIINSVVNYNGENRN